MAADWEALYRAAVGAQLGQPDTSPQVRDLARLLARLIGPLARRPGEPGYWRLEIDFDPRADQPAIRPWRGVWGELD